MARIQKRRDGYRKLNTITMFDPRTFELDGQVFLPMVDYVLRGDNDIMFDDPLHRRAGSDVFLVGTREMVFESVHSEREIQPEYNSNNGVFEIQYRCSRRIRTDIWNYLQHSVQDFIRTTFTKGQALLQASAYATYGDVDAALSYLFYTKRFASKDIMYLTISECESGGDHGLKVNVGYISGRHTTYHWYAMEKNNITSDDGRVPEFTSFEEMTHIAQMWRNLVLQQVMKDVSNLNMDLWTLIVKWI